MNRIRLLGAAGISLVTSTLTMAGSAVAEPPPGAVPVTTATAAQPAGSPAPAGHAAAFLRVDSVQGEATDANHKGWIEVSSFSFGATHATNGGAAGASAGRTTPSEIVITKPLDKSSAELRLAQASGTHFKNAVIEMTKPSSNGQTAVYYRVTMTDVYVAGARVIAPSGSSVVPSESVTFVYGKVTVEYSQRNADGSSSPYQAVREDYDVRTNVKF